jgi:hypothetical protein
MSEENREKQIGNKNLVELDDLNLRSQMAGKKESSNRSDNTTTAKYSELACSLLIFENDPRAGQDSRGYF